MSGIEKLRAANAKAQAIVAHYKGLDEQTPDVIEARVKELKALSKDDLIDLLVKLEAPKSDKAFKVEDIVKDILEAPECATYTYEQIAALVQQALPGAKTSSKSVASYASKKKDEWHIAKREKFALSNDDLLKLAVNA